MQDCWLSQPRPNIHVRRSLSKHLPSARDTFAETRPRTRPIHSD